MGRARVRVERLTHSFGSGPPVLREVELTVEPGEVLVVHGRNGAGKSTLLRLVVGLLRPSSGTVTREGRVGYLPQRGDAPPPRMSAGDWLTSLSRMRGDRGTSTTSLLDALYVDTPAQPMDQLSVGTVGKVLLAGALGGQPDLLVLDEPFAPLDAAACAAAASLIAERARGGAAVVLSDHQRAGAAIATRSVTIAGGQVRVEAAVPAGATWRIVATDAAGEPRDLLVPAADREAVLLRLLTDGARIVRVEELP